MNKPEELSKVLDALTKIQGEFNNDGKQVSIADLVVLAGNAGVEHAAKAAGHEVKVPFVGGRADASQEQTDVVSFAALEPAADGFRNYFKPTHKVSAEEMLVDKAQLLTLSIPEMTALIGGFRSININYDGSEHGVFTNQPGALTNDYFVHLLDLSTTWRSVNDAQDAFEGRDRKTGETKWKGTRADMIFGSNSELRAWLRYMVPLMQKANS